MRYLVQTLITAGGLWLADYLVTGIHIRSTGVMIVAALVLGIINAIVRPILLVLTLPLTIVTLGLFILVLNAAMFGLAAALLPGFHVDGFWAALFGTIIVSLTSWAASGVLLKPDSG